MNAVVSAKELHERIRILRGPVDEDAAAAIVVPVNAQGDLEKVSNILFDITEYEGSHRFEIVLVVNNYPPDRPPDAIKTFGQLGINVVATPTVRKPGEAVGFTARIAGVREATAELAILFDADCRIPNASALLDWYVEQFQNGADVAYTHVEYYELKKDLSVRARMVAHHASRWFKRVVLRIPTTRGSNYAVKRSVALKYYDEGMLADEMNVGPTFKRFGGKVVYSGDRKLVVLTSGRMFRGGWLKLYRYLRYRLRYNLRVLPVGSDAARRTKRESDPVRRYVDNVPVQDDDQT